MLKFITNARYTTSVQLSKFNSTHKYSLRKYWTDYEAFKVKLWQTLYPLLGFGMREKPYQPTYLTPARHEFNLWLQMPMSTLGLLQKSFFAWLNVKKAFSTFNHAKKLLRTTVLIAPICHFMLKRTEGKSCIPSRHQTRARGLEKPSFNF